jgi:GntR family transcriptional regulator
MGDFESTLVRTTGPLYRDVAAALEMKIRNGIWKPGEQIPSESELEQQFGASRGTLRAAVAQLVKKGLLNPQPGRGTFVCGPYFQSYERYFNYQRTGADARLMSVKVLRQSRRKADKATAAALGIGVGEEVGHLRRLWLQNDEPFLLVSSFFAGDIWEKIEGASFDIHPMYQMLQDKHDVYILSGDEYLQAGLATKEESTHLKIAPNSAVIYIERIAYTFESRPVEHRIATGRADRFRYHVKLV